MSLCNVLLCDGIGNIIQSIPFIKELRNHYDTVIGVDRADSKEAKNLVAHLFDNIISINEKRLGVNYSIPPLNAMGSYPEYKSWFKFHKIPIPKKLEIVRDDIRFKSVAYQDFPEVILWPGCKPNWVSKRWPYYAELAEMLLGTSSVGVVGLKGDGGSFSSKVIDFRGKLSLLETGGVVNKANIYIGNEGGISHYAAALNNGNQSTFIIFGLTDPIKNTQPLKNKVKTISLNLECQPCQFKQHDYSNSTGCKTLKCLKELTSNTIYNTVTKGIK